MARRSGRPQTPCPGAKSARKPSSLGGGKTTPHRKTLGNLPGRHAMAVHPQTTGGGVGRWSLIRDDRPDARRSPAPRGFHRCSFVSLEGLCEKPPLIEEPPLIR